MTKQMITALALVALGLIGISLAMCSAILNVSLPPEHLAHVDDNILTTLFLASFFGGVVLLGFGACWWDALRDEQQEMRRRAPFVDMKQEIRDYRKKMARR